MKKVLLLAVCFAWAVSAAPIPCSSGDVLSSGFSCAIGGLTFSNFQVVVADAGNTPTPHMTLVNASIDTTKNEAVLNFNPQMSASLAPGMPSFQDLWFYFTVTGGVTGIDLAVRGQNAVITETACSSAIDQVHGNICTGGLANQLAVLTASSGQAVMYSNPFPTTSPIYVYKDISVTPTPTSTVASLTSFEQSFVLAGGSGGPGGGQVPEPGSFFTLGAGLLVGAFMLKRFRRT